MPDNNKKILLDSFNRLYPYSTKYRVDFDRYLYTINLVTSLVKKPGNLVLDVGCGIGITALSLNKLGFKTIGIDKHIFKDKEKTYFALDDINYLKNIWQKENLEIMEKDIIELDAPDNSCFDLIIAEAIIEHQTDPKKFLLKINELLKSGGVAVISSPNLTTLLKRTRFMFGRSPNWDLQQFFNYGKNFTGHWREYTLNELTQMAEMTGFIILKKININLLAKFRGINKLRWIYIYLFKIISDFLPDTRDMNYIVIKKP